MAEILDAYDHFDAHGTIVLSLLDATLSKDVCTWFMWYILVKFPLR